MKIFATPLTAAPALAIETQSHRTGRRGGGGGGRRRRRRRRCRRASEERAAVALDRLLSVRQGPLRFVEGPKRQVRPSAGCREPAGVRGTRPGVEKTFSGATHA